MPKKFQGTWIDAEDRSYSMAIGPKAVIIGEPLKLLSIVPCDEKLNPARISSGKPALVKRRWFTACSRSMAVKP